MVVCVIFNDGKCVVVCVIFNDGKCAKCVVVCELWQVCDRTRCLQLWQLQVITPVSSKRSWRIMPKIAWYTNSMNTSRKHPETRAVGIVWLYLESVLRHLVSISLLNGYFRSHTLTRKTGTINKNGTYGSLSVVIDCGKHRPRACPKMSQDFEKKEKYNLCIW